jgi:molecular chaperone Hsp33
MSDSTALPQSRLYTFIDEPREYALYFLEGQRLIHDLALVHPIEGAGFAYFRETVLSVQPMIALLKEVGEQIGFYLDSEDPKFQFKIETSHQGDTRCLLLPENFQQFPEAMTGRIRVQRLYPRNRSPYESIIEVEGLALREIINRVLRDSYQVDCAIAVSESSDQSLMLHQLPMLRGRDEDPDAARKRREGIREGMESVFSQGLVEPQEIAEGFQRIGFRLLAHRPVRFQCNCSWDRFLAHLAPIWLKEGESLFDPDQQTLEVKCEYCKTKYEYSRDDLRKRAESGDRPS